VRLPFSRRAGISRLRSITHGEPLGRTRIILYNDGGRSHETNVINASRHLRDIPLRPTADGTRGFARYTAFATAVTVLGYSLGYSTIGFGLLFLGALWGLGRYRVFLWTRTPLDLPLAVFGGVLVISAVASPYRGLASGVTLMLLISGAVYLGSFVWLLERDAALRSTLLRLWAIGAVIAALVGLAYSSTTHVQILITSWSSALSHARAEIPRGVGPNGLGTTLLLGSIVSLGLAFKSSDWDRWLWAGAGVVCLAGLVASGSRASLAGWGFGTAYLVWRELRARPARMAAVTIAGLVLLIGITAATPQFTNRLIHTPADVAGNRVEIWHTSFQMIAARPFLGTGFGTFETAYDKWRSPRMSPEPFAFNLWLNLAVETGLVGLGAALWVAVAALQAWRSGRWRRQGVATDVARHGQLWRPVIAALWVGLLVDQFADNTLFSISTSAVLWLLLALLVVPNERTGSWSDVVESDGR